MLRCDTQGPQLITTFKGHTGKLLNLLNLGTSKIHICNIFIITSFIIIGIIIVITIILVIMLLLLLLCIYNIHN